MNRRLDSMRQFYKKPKKDKKKKKEILPPTEAQLRKLTRLGYEGRVHTKKHAAKLIRAILNTGYKEVKVEKPWLPPEEFQAQLNKKEITSETWFKDQLKVKNLKFDFKFNEPIYLEDITYYADFYDEKNKVIIELDGTIHKLRHVKNKDLIRDVRLEDSGYKVIRIKHNDFISLDEGIAEYLNIVMGRKSTYGLEYKPNISHTTISSKKACSLCKQKGTKLVRFDYKQKTYKYCPKCYSDYSRFAK